MHMHMHMHMHAHTHTHTHTHTRAHAHTHTHTHTSHEHTQAACQTPPFAAPDLPLSPPSSVPLRSWLYFRSLADESLPNNFPEPAAVAVAAAGATRRGEAAVSTTVSTAVGTAAGTAAEAGAAAATSVSATVDAGLGVDECELVAETLVGGDLSGRAEMQWTLEAAAQPLDVAGFRRALRRLDFKRGDALGTLTEAEVAMLVSSCDGDGDGCVDGREWCDRFASALRRLSGEGLITDVEEDSADLHVEHSSLWPRCLEEGSWPSVDEWGLSDHGVLTSRFALALDVSNIE